MASAARTTRIYQALFSVVRPAPTGSGVAANELLLSRDGSQRRGHNRRPDKRNADGVTELNPRAVAGRTSIAIHARTSAPFAPRSCRYRRTCPSPCARPAPYNVGTAFHIWSEIGGEPPELLDLPDDETQATLAGRLSTFASEDVTSLTQTYWNTFFAFIGTGPAIQAAREAEDSEALAAALALERALRQLTGVRGAPTLLDLPSFTAITATQPSGLPPNVGDLGDAALRELLTPGQTYEGQNNNATRPRRMRCASCRTPAKGRPDVGTGTVATFETLRGFNWRLLHSARPILCGAGGAVRRHERIGTVQRELPTGTVTFLFTDIEGSTRLLDALGAEAYADALAKHRRALRAAFERHGGVEVDTQGDAFFYAFPTAPGALQAAAEGQEALSAGSVRVRMGLHTGTPHVTAEGYVGVDVHRAARIAATAHGGQVLISASTAALAAPTRCATSATIGSGPVRGRAAVPARGRRVPSAQEPAPDEPARAVDASLGRERELAEVCALLVARETFAC